MSLLAPDDVAPSSGANRLPIRHSTYLVHPGLQAFFYHSEQEMSDPFAAQKEILWRAERAVQEREREIIEFRRRCEAYEKFLHDQLAKDKSLVAILKEDIAGREKSVARILPGHCHRQTKEAAGLQGYRSYSLHCKRNPC